MNMPLDQNETIVFLSNRVSELDAENAKLADSLASANKENAQLHIDLEWRNKQHEELYSEYAQVFNARGDYAQKCAYFSQEAEREREESNRLRGELIAAKQKLEKTRKELAIIREQLLKYQTQHGVI